ncbi:MAG: hypothetical protein FWE05_04645 [Defluviitaleaceae bacterium]|nr:hypothetical protein [Defluviitaleaceae bacterium]
MKRHNNRSIDPLRKMVLPSAIRQDLKLEPKDQVSLMPVETLVVLWRIDGEPSSHCYTSEIDELGRIEVPFELMFQLSWNVLDEISIHSIDNLVILKSV